MRICYFADGRYIHALRWMRYFAGKGHEMHLISFAEVGSEQIAELKVAGIKYHGHTGNFHLKKFWLTLRDISFVRTILFQEKIDILHSHFLGPNAWYGTLSGFHPHIITIMGGDVIGETWLPNKGFREKVLTTRALEHADTITAWSPFLANIVKPFCKSASEISVVHGGVQLDRFARGIPNCDLREKLGIPVDAKFVFSARLLRRLYNIDVIAMAAGIVCEKYPETYFVIALPETILDSEYTEGVKKLIAEGSAAENVRFVSTISHDDIPNYFKEADVSVSIPSTDGTPMSVLESMAAGTPTVIGDLINYDREYFEDEVTTLMIDVQNPEALAHAILRYFTDKELVTNITNEALRRVEETGSYEFQMEKMDAIYNRVLRR